MSRESALVTTDWVSGNLTNPKVVFVEVDEDTTLYEQGHIQGAITFHWRDDLQDGLVRDLVSKEKFEALLSKNGIANDTTVVLYGGNNNWFATYAYWYFKIYGHQDVRLIDGGRKLWELKALPLVKEVPARAATRYVAKERDNTIRAFRDEVIAPFGTPSAAPSLSMTPWITLCLVRSIPSSDGPPGVAPHVLNYAPTATGTPTNEPYSVHDPS